MMFEYVIFGVLLIAALGAGALFFSQLIKFRASNVHGREEQLAACNAEIETLRTERSDQQAQMAELKADLRNASLRIEELSEERRLQAAQIERVINERNELKEQVVRDAEAAKNLDNRIRDLLEAKELMRQEFNDIAGRLMKSHGETFKEQNKEQIANLLTPFREKIESFEKQVAESNRHSRDQHAALIENIKIMTTQSALMSQETQNLTRALKGNVQLQGAWGEMVLETILQRSGLREGEEYTRQESHSAEDGGRVRTDYIVHLPNGERIIIDAKVSLKDFEGYVSAGAEEERSTRLAAHAASVRSHIKKLAGKEYHTKVVGKLDFVIMFMTIEPALGAALQQDKEIVHFAADNKVAIATPTTLTIALKTVAAIWRVERQNRNAAEIASRAGKLYDKFVGFLDDMSAIGDNLKRVESAYEGAMKKLSHGQGNLVWQVEKLKGLGADTNKHISANYLDDTQALLETEGEAIEYRKLDIGSDDMDDSDGIRDEGVAHQQSLNK